MKRQRQTTRSTFGPADIFAALNAAHVKYLVVGGLAVVLHGVSRFTWDVDLTVELTTDNLDRLAKALKRLGFVPRVPAPVQGLADAATRRHWVQQKHMTVFSFIQRTSPPRVVDILLNPPGRFDAIHRRRAIVKAWGIAVPLVPVDVLVKMKQAAGRPQDLFDAQALKALDRRA